MDNELKPCPFCGGEAEFGEGFAPNIANGFYVRCIKCDAQTFIKGTKKSARDAWNRRAEPKNPQLTLEQLQKMDGEQVWIEVLTNKALSQWVVISKQDESTIFASGGRLSLSLRGETWVAYAHKPESEELRCCTK